MKKYVKEYLLLTLSTTALPVGGRVYFFQFPNHFTTGGVSGISILLGEVLTFATPATMNMIINYAPLYGGADRAGQGIYPAHGVCWCFTR